MARKKLGKSKSVYDLLIELENLVTGIRKDAEKFDSGNQASGARIRKAMQEIKKNAQEMRIIVQEIKNSR